MAGHSRSNNGVASLAYVPAIPIMEARIPGKSGQKSVLPGPLQITYMAKWDTANCGRTAAGFLLVAGSRWDRRPQGWRRAQRVAATNARIG
jgi:hypothetical protein